VAERAKEIILHSLGVQLAASTLPWSRLIYGYAEELGGTPRSTVVNYGLRTSPESAAYVNGAFAHGFELDDNHSRTSVKGGCVAVPAALAVGEDQHSSGEDVITAVAAAFEVMLRVGLAIRPGVMGRGAHPTGSSGPFGAATVASKLLGLDELTTAYALSSAGTNIVGLSEIPADGRGHLKRTFGGAAAAAGIRAARLAAAGLTGPLTTLNPEVTWGSFTGFFGVDPEHGRELTAGLGSTWHILGVHYKIYAQDGYIQPMTDALREIRQQVSFDSGEIEEVRIGTNQHAHDHVIGAIREPRDLTDAQFSAAFSVALYLVRGGAGFADYTPDALTDPRITELSKRVHIEVDEELDRDYATTRARSAVVTVRLASGAEHTARIPSLRQLTPAEVDEKFTSLAAVVLPPDQVATVRDTVRNLEKVPDVSGLLPLLVGVTGQSPS
jgi:2-methylcitrate dehydratase PrpD